MPATYSSPPLRPLSVGAWAGPSYCALVSHPVGVWQTVHSLGYVTIPLVTSAATFAATSCALTNLRGKDDAWNPTLGGLAAGSIFGAASESTDATDTVSDQTCDGVNNKTELERTYAAAVFNLEYGF